MPRSAALCFSIGEKFGLKQVVTNRVSQFFTVDSFRVEGKDPLVVSFLGERITYGGRTETERKPYQYRLTLATWKELSRTLMAWCNLSEPR